MASEQAKALIAKQIAHGFRKTHVAKLHGYYSPANLDKLLKTEDMQRRIAREQEQIGMRFDNAMTVLAEQVGKSADNVAAIANDLEHKDSYKANTYILDAFIGNNKDDSDKTQIRVNVSDSVFEVIATNMADLAKARNSAIFGGPLVAELLEGDDALPVTADVSGDMPPREAVPAGLDDPNTEHN